MARRIELLVPDVSKVADFTRPFAVHLPKRYLQRITNMPHPMSQLLGFTPMVPGFVAENSVVDTLVLGVDFSSRDSIDTPEELPPPYLYEVSSIGGMALVFMAFAVVSSSVSARLDGMEVVPTRSYKQHVESCTGVLPSILGDK